jgi:hypothetical protein
MFVGPNGTKRADFIVNLTNDGWFATPQMQQHLQLADLISNGPHTACGRFPYAS